MDVVQKITSVEVTSPRVMERKTEGIIWGGDVRLISGTSPLHSREIRMAIDSSKLMTFDALNAIAQSTYSKGYDELSVTESNIVQGNTLALNIITNLTEADSGISPEDITALVTTIVTTIV